MALGIKHLFDESRLMSANGDITGATIYFYYSGTSTLAPIYSDNVLTTPATNPFTVAAGAVLPAVYLDPVITYRRRVVFTDGSEYDNDFILTGIMRTETSGFVGGVTGNSASLRLATTVMASEIGISFDCGNQGYGVRDSAIIGGNNGSNQTYLDFYTSNAAVPAVGMRLDYAGWLNLYNGVRVSNNKAVSHLNTSGSGAFTFILQNDDNFCTYALNSGGSVAEGVWSFMTGHATGAGTFYISSGVNKVLPSVANNVNLGSAGNPFNGLWVQNAVVVTSDEQTKTWRGEITEAELVAATELTKKLGFYQLNDSIDVKGAEAARFHFGVKAQDIARELIAAGVEDDQNVDTDPTKFIPEEERPSFKSAFLCFDTWEETETIPAREEVRDPETNEITQPALAEVPGTPAGSLLGVRLEQLALYLIAAQAKRIDDLEARLAALEVK